MPGRRRSFALLVAGCGGGGGDADRRPQPTPPVSGQTGDEVPAGRPAARLPGLRDQEHDARGGRRRDRRRRRRRAGHVSRAHARVAADRGDPGRGARLADRASPRPCSSARPIRAPILFADGDTIPDATKAALDALQPTGSKEAGGAQVIRVGTKAPVEGYKTTDVTRRQPGRAGRRRRPRCSAAAAGAPSSAVVVANADRPEYAMPAAGWAAKSGNPLLWVSAQRRPAGDRGGDQDPQVGQDLRARARPTSVPDTVLDALEKLGTVKRIAGDRPGDHARSRSRASQDGDFGWSVVDPGHGLVFASTRRPQDAAAAAPLSATGTYGPLLLLPDAGVLPAAAAGLPARHPARLRRRPGPRRLQPRLDHRRRERDRRRRPGAHRYALGDPARRHRSPVRHGRSRAARTPARRPRGHRRRHAPARRLRHAALRLPDPQPDPEADRGPAGRRPGAALRRGARSRRSSRSASPARSAARPSSPACASSPSVNETEQPRYIPGATAVERAARPRAARELGPPRDAARNVVLTILLLSCSRRGHDGPPHASRAATRDGRAAQRPR